MIKSAPYILVSAALAFSSCVESRPPVLTGANVAQLYAAGRMELSYTASLDSPVYTLRVTDAEQVALIEQCLNEGKPARARVEEPGVADIYLSSESDPPCYNGRTFRLSISGELGDLSGLYYCRLKEEDVYAKLKNMAIKHGVVQKRSAMGK